MGVCENGAQAEGPDDGSAGGRTEAMSEEFNDVANSGGVIRSMPKKELRSMPKKELSLN